MPKVKDESIDIAKVLLRVRQDHRLSQEQFAQSLGVTRQAVSRWEMGISIPSHSTLKQISEIYEVSIDTILNNQSCDNTPSESKAPMIPSFTLGLLFVCIGFLGVIALVFSQNGCFNCRIIVIQYRFWALYNRLLIVP